MSYHHLTTEERERLLGFIASGKSIDEAAKELGRHRSTLYREIRRNGGRKEWLPSRAQKRYIRKRRRCRREFKLRKDTSARSAVLTGLIYRWSPEQIVCCLGVEVSVPTIYRALRRGVLPRHYSMNLRHRGKCYRPRKAKDPGCRMPGGLPIEQRPEEVNLRVDLGHWEADTMCGSKGSGAIATFVERKTRLLRAIRLPDQTAASMESAMKKALIGLPCKTITTDNGKEFSRFSQVQEALSTLFYFANPHSPWEKGAVENMNGLLRQYFPKGSSFESVAQSDVDRAVLSINNRPRKCLDWRTPLEAFSGQMSHLD